MFFPTLLLDLKLFKLHFLSLFLIFLQFFFSSDTKLDNFQRLLTFYLTYVNNRLLKTLYLCKDE